MKFTGTEYRPINSLKKEEAQQKRRDIFVDSLEILGYIRKNDEGKYELAVDLDKERLMFSKQ